MCERNGEGWGSVVVMFVCAEVLHPSPQFFTHVRTSSTDQDKVSRSKTQHRAFGEPTTPQSQV